MTEELFPSKYEKDFSFTVAIVFMKDQIVLKILSLSRIFISNSSISTLKTLVIIKHIPNSKDFIWTLE